jgi:hypothetical protein
LQDEKKEMKTMKRSKNSMAVLLMALCLVCTGLSTVDAAEEGEWISLFNGKNLDGWTPKIKGYAFGENFGNTFRVEDGMMKVRYDQYDTFDKRYGHIFYKDSFSHYRLRIEYRFVGEQVKGGEGWALRNSGIMMHCQDPKTMRLDQDFPVSIEVQMLGGNGKDKRTTGNLCTPGTNVMLNGELWTQHCTGSTSDTYHGEQWVTLEVEAHGGETIKHYVNGTLVMEYDKPQLDERDADAKKLIKDGNLIIEGGYFSLQSESHPLDIRKVEILLLDE